MTAIREAFLQLLSMSLTSSLVIAVICLLRLLLKRAPKKFSYWLWAAAAFRLACPFSISAVFSIFSLSGTQTVYRTGPVTRIRYLPAAIPAPEQAPPSPQAGTASPLPAPEPDFFTVCGILWLLGAALMLAAAVYRYRKTCLQVRAAVLLRPPVYECDAIRSPFVLGFLRPKIYLPFGLDSDQQEYLLCHEAYHIKRRDYLVKPLAFLLLCLHWFNPLVWLAFVLMSRDMEMSCDEKVLDTLGDGLKRNYSLSLLAFGSNRRFPSPNPLAFGETSLRERVKNVLSYRRTGAFVTALAVTACILTAAACSANPAQPEQQSAPSPAAYQVEGAEDEVDSRTAQLLSLLFDCQDKELLEIMALPAPAVTPLPNGDYPTVISNPAIEEALKEYYENRFPADYFTEEAYDRFFTRVTSQWNFSALAGLGELHLVTARRLPAETGARSWVAAVKAVLLPSGDEQEFEIPVTVQESEGKLTFLQLGDEVGSLQQYFFRSAAESEEPMSAELEALRAELENRESEQEELQAELFAYEAQIEALSSELETAGEGGKSAMEEELSSVRAQYSLLLQKSEALEEELRQLRQQLSGRQNVAGQAEGQSLPPESPEESGPKNLPQNPPAPTPDSVPPASSDLPDARPLR